jgi:hypothetical protein
VQHTSSELFVPAGLDSADLIDGVSKASPLARLQAGDVAAAENPFAGRAAKKSAGAAEEGDGERVEGSSTQPTLLEDEQGWLATLHTEIEQSTFVLLMVYYIILFCFIKYFSHFG